LGYFPSLCFKSGDARGEALPLSLCAALLILWRGCCPGLKLL
jgi:hypothetical protein